jgi:hypothetical protein
MHQIATTPGSAGDPNSSSASTPDTAADARYGLPSLDIQASVAVEPSR